MSALMPRRRTKPSVAGIPILIFAGVVAIGFAVYAYFFAQRIDSVGFAFFVLIGVFSILLAVSVFYWERSRLYKQNFSSF